MNYPLFVTGISTEIGKTVVSTVLTQAFGAAYWKPVQAGDLDASDSIKVERLVSNPASRVFPERYRLKEACSPHLAAAHEGIEIRLEDFEAPTTDKLFIEGAGGLFSPLSSQSLMIDLIAHLGADAIVVSKNYLGSINHTLLTLEALKQRKIPVVALIFSGTPNKDSEDFIIEWAKPPRVGRVPFLATLDKASVAAAAVNIREDLAL